MTSVAYVEKHLRHILEERATVLAREPGCIVRQRKFTGAALVHTLVCGFGQQPHASLEQLASTAQMRAVSVTDTAVHDRFTEQTAQLLQRVLEEMNEVVVEAAQPVPLALLRRFAAVYYEDSTTMVLPDELAAQWQGCGGTQAHTQAAVKAHTRLDLKRGRLWGPSLTPGRTSDRQSPFNALPTVDNSLFIGDLGYFSVPRMMQRHAGGGYTLTRLLSSTALFTPEGDALVLSLILPKEVGQLKELEVVVGSRRRHPMRLLLLRVPQEVGDKRRQNLREEARRRQQEVSAEALWLADWTVLVTDAPATLLRAQEALVLLRERWQLELLYKVWKQHAQVDEWHTANPWRILCELYAKLIGVLLQHWLIVLFAWHDPQRSLVKLAQVCRAVGGSIMEALGGFRSLRSALRLIQRRMRSGCQMNTRRAHPNSAQLLEAQAVEWALTWCE